MIATPKLRGTRRISPWPALAVPLLAAACQAPPSAPGWPDTVAVSGGQIQGLVSLDGVVRSFKGIPYAAPPAGELRFRPPRPAASWQGVLPTLAFSPACMQNRRPAGSFYGPGAEEMSEDCLYLNVWSAAASPSERRPVMVWIHGGGLRNGHGGVGTYDGEALARRGVVLVTLNYRLGPFGFLAHHALSEEDEHGSSGNYGMLDQIAALEWVRDNATAFGGDPERVTIFGESAGSLSVSYLQASPLAAGLFHRAIGQSGSALRASPHLSQESAQGEPAERVGERFARTLLGAEVEVSAAALRAASAERILETFATDGVDFASRANVDGWFLPDTVAAIFESGRQSDVPVIVGWNHDEGTALAGEQGPHSLAELEEYASSQFGRLAPRFHELYPASTDEEARRAYLRAYGVQRFGWGAREWARLMSNVSAPAYLYHFVRVPPGEQSQRYGAYHAAEIAYVFGNLDRSTTGGAGRPWEEVDRQLAELLGSYWVNFAAGGDPNGDALPQWPAYDAAGDACMVFGEKPETGPGVRKDELDFFDQVEAARRGKDRSARSVSP